MAKPIQKKLTDKSVRALQPRDTPFVAWDTSVKGFGVQVLPSGTKTLILHMRVNGKQIKKKLARVTPVTSTADINECRKVADQLKRDAELHGTDPREARRSGMPTLWEFIEEDYLPWQAERKSTWRLDRQMLRDYLPPKLKKSPLNAITFQDVEALHRSMADKAPTANRFLSALRMVFKRAAKLKVIPADANPTDGVDNHKERKRDRVLTPDELKRFLAAIDAYAEEKIENKPGGRHGDPRDRAAAIKLLLLTGCRSGELIGNSSAPKSRTARPLTAEERVRDKSFGARWAEFDLERGIWHKPKTKNGREHVVPLAPEAVALLQEVKARQRDGEEFVFPDVASVHSAFRRILEIAKIKDFRPHDLRHQFVSEILARADKTGTFVSPHTLAGLTGHSSLKVLLERYAQHFEDPMRDTLAVMSDVYGEATGKEKESS